MLFQLLLTQKNVDEIVKTIKYISPVFGGINIEDIAAPRCFEIEEKLQGLGIPVMHDDQHGTAIVVLAALINASKVIEKDLGELKVVVNGAGAAGTAITNFLTCFGDENNKVCKSVKDVIVCDSKGIIHQDRQDLNEYKKKLATISNKEKKHGSLEKCLKRSRCFYWCFKGKHFR